MVYESGNWSVQRLSKRSYTVWLWLSESQEWCNFGKYRSKVAAIRFIEEVEAE